MDGTERLPRPTRRRLCGARLATVVWIGIAALASCQPFRDDNAAVDPPGEIIRIGDAEPSPSP